MGRTIAQCILASVTFLFCGTEAHAVDEPAPAPRSVSVAKSDIDDEFFAFVVGLLVNDIEARYDLDTLLSAFPVYRESDGNTPINRLLELSRLRSPAVNREAADGGSPMVSVSFDADFDYPIPIDIFGYNPGDVEVAAILSFREESFQSRTVSTDRREAVELSPLYVLTLESGRLFIDFDGIVDTLAFGAFDDLDAKTILLFGFRDEWYAILAGEGHRDRIHEWTFNLESTTFMRRPPRPLRGVADHFIDVSP